MIYNLNSMCLNIVYVYTCVYNCVYNLCISPLYIIALLQPPYANCLPLAILKLLEEYGIIKIGAIGLTSYHGTNYKWPPIMTKLMTDILELAPISNNQSQARKARHTIPACKYEARHGIPACKVQTSYPIMHTKSHCIKELQEPRIVDKLWASEEPNIED